MSAERDEPQEQLIEAERQLRLALAGRRVLADNLAARLAAWQQGLALTRWASASSGPSIALSQHVLRPGSLDFAAWLRRGGGRREMAEWWPIERFWWERLSPELALLRRRRARLLAAAHARRALRHASPDTPAAPPAGPGRLLEPSAPEEAVALPLAGQAAEPLAPSAPVTDAASDERLPRTSLSRPSRLGRFGAGLRAAWQRLVMVLAPAPATSSSRPVPPAEPDPRPLDPVTSLPAAPDASATPGPPSSTPAGLPSALPHESGSEMAVPQPSVTRPDLAAATEAAEQGAELATSAAPAPMDRLVRLDALAGREGDGKDSAPASTASSSVPEPAAGAAAPSSPLPLPLLAETSLAGPLPSSTSGEPHPPERMPVEAARAAALAVPGPAAGEPDDSELDDWADVVMAHNLADGEQGDRWSRPSARALETGVLSEEGPAVALVAPLLVSLLRRLDSGFSVALPGSTTATALAAPSRLFWWPAIDRERRQRARLAATRRQATRAEALMIASTASPAAGAAASSAESGPAEADSAETSVNPAAQSVRAEADAPALVVPSRPEWAARVVFEGTYIGRRRSLVRPRREAAPRPLQASAAQPGPSVLPPPPPPLPPPEQPGLLGTLEQRQYLGRRRQSLREAMVARAEGTSAWATQALRHSERWRIRLPAIAAAVSGPGTGAPAVETPALVLADPGTGRRIHPSVASGWDDGPWTGAGAIPDSARPRAEPGAAETTSVAGQPSMAVGGSAPAPGQEAPADNLAAGETVSPKPVRAALTDWSPLARLLGILAHRPTRPPAAEQGPSPSGPPADEALSEGPSEGDMPRSSLETAASPPAVSQTESDQPDQLRTRAGGGAELPATPISQAGGPIRPSASVGRTAVPPFQGQAGLPPSAGRRAGPVRLPATRTAAGRVATEAAVARPPIEPVRTPAPERVDREPSGEASPGPYPAGSDASPRPIAPPSGLRRVLSALAGRKQPRSLPPGLPESARARSPAGSGSAERPAWPERSAEALPGGAVPGAPAAGHGPVFQGARRRESIVARSTATGMTEQPSDQPAAATGLRRGGALTGPITPVSADRAPAPPPQPGPSLLRTGAAPFSASDDGGPWSGPAALEAPGATEAGVAMLPIHLSATGRLLGRAAAAVEAGLTVRPSSPASQPATEARVTRRSASLGLGAVATTVEPLRGVLARRTVRAVAMVRQSGDHDRPARPSGGARETALPAAGQSGSAGAAPATPVWWLGGGQGHAVGVEWATAGPPISAAVTAGPRLWPGATIGAAVSGSGQSGRLATRIEGMEAQLAEIIRRLPAPMAAQMVAAGRFDPARLSDAAQAPSADAHTAGRATNMSLVLAPVPMARSGDTAAQRGRAADHVAASPSLGAVRAGAGTTGAAPATAPAAPGATIVQRSLDVQRQGGPAGGQGDWPPATPDQSTEPAAEPNLDALADQVFEILRWRLVAERERVRGWE